MDSVFMIIIAILITWMVIDWQEADHPIKKYRIYLDAMRDEYILRYRDNDYMVYEGNRYQLVQISQSVRYVVIKGTNERVLLSDAHMNDLFNKARE